MSENLFLRNPLADSDLRTRLRPRSEDVRGHYFRDLTAIIHSPPFRRMKQKTQVFFCPRNDDICTRIEHVMHVATVAATICRALGLNHDLVWAIAMGHDLGHPPFGHLGERILDRLIRHDGGFCHETNSLRVVDRLAEDGKGLNLTYAVRDGIVSHCGEKFEQSIEIDPTLRDLSSIQGREFYPATWEGVIVRMSDKIAYLGRDLEDAVQLGITRIEALPDIIAGTLGTRNAEIINTLVLDVIDTALDTGRIGFSDDIFGALKSLKSFNYENIYRHDLLTGHNELIERIITTLYDFLLSVHDSYARNAPSGTSPTDSSAGLPLARSFCDYLATMGEAYSVEGEPVGRIVVDYIAGMTDGHALECGRELGIQPPETLGRYLAD